MATISARRKHGTCLLRIRENCPFRKLRKHRYDVSAASSSGVGVPVHWRDFMEPPILSASSQPISTIYSEPLPPAAIYLNVFLPHQSQGPDIMDMDLVEAPAGNMRGLHLSPSSVLGPGPLVPNLLPPDHHQQLRASAAPCETSMELDSGVDPETGERAQG